MCYMISQQSGQLKQFISTLLIYLPIYLYLFALLAIFFSHLTTETVKLILIPHRMKLLGFVTAIQQCAQLILISFQI